MKASENILGMVHAFPDEARKDEVRKLAKLVADMEEFIRNIRDNYDCDTGANGCHPYHCRVCNADDILKRNK